MTKFNCYPPCGDLVPAEKARDRIMESVRATTQTDTVTLENIPGRILADDIKSTVSIPPQDNSAMDGFAVRCADLIDNAAGELKITGTAWAGEPFDGAVATGEAVRIMTGAFIPNGADAVVAKEDTSSKDDRVMVNASVRVGENIRSAAEDTRAGDTILSRGRQVNGGAVSVLASIGQNQLQVFRRIRVGIVSTGNELIEPGQIQSEGRIYDSNRPLLGSMLSRLNADVVDLGIVRDNPDDVAAMFEQAAGQVDVLITSGGASTGEADYVADCLNTLGEVGLWRVALRPGRPFAFGRLDDTLFFGLPGNPVAVAATFFYFVRPALRKMAGLSEPFEVLLFPARCAERIRKKPDRVEIYRANYSMDGDSLSVRTTGSQGSGLLRSLVTGNCLFTLQHDDTDKDPGDIVLITPLSELL